MCCLGLAFTSCKPDPKPYEKFVGEYLGNIELEGKLTAVAVPGVELDLTGAHFSLGAKIDPSTNENQVYVTFTVQEENYTTTGNVKDNTIEFGTLSYTYVDKTTNTEFLVHLDLTGTLTNENTITLTGPFTGNGGVTYEGMTMIMNTSGSVTGSLNRLAQ